MLRVGAHEIARREDQLLFLDGSGHVAAFFGRNAERLFDEHMFARTRRGQNEVAVPIRFRTHDHGRNLRISPNLLQVRALPGAELGGYFLSARRIVVPHSFHGHVQARLDQVDEGRRMDMGDANECKRDFLLLLPERLWHDRGRERRSCGFLDEFPAIRFLSRSGSVYWWHSAQCWPIFLSMPTSKSPWSHKRARSRTAEGSSSTCGFLQRLRSLPASLTATFWLNLRREKIRPDFASRVRRLRPPLQRSSKPTSECCFPKPGR